MINPTDTIFVALFHKQGTGDITIYSVHANEQSMIDRYSGWEGFNNEPIWLPNDHTMEELAEQDEQVGMLPDDYILIQDALPLMILTDNRNNLPDNDPYAGMIKGYELTCAQLNRIMDEQEA